MGVVYKAEDTKLKRTVALKFLSPHLLTDETQKSRFLHEAQAAAALDHPNISTIHEVHEADGHAFMVMAYIEGEDVGTKLQSGPMDLEEALDIAIQVCRGLAKAHSAGVVHRDIKPGNVIITPEGQAKIVDFGLAKLADQTRLTKTGASVGTVRYMSPEQSSGGDVDHRTDIWSFGVMLYEMLAGEIPFRGEIEQAMIYSILHEDPQSITSRRKDVPIGLEDIIEKALAKDPDKRYATMDELLAELETQRDHITLGIKERRFTAMRKFRRRKRIGALVGAVVVIVVGVMLMQVFQTPSVGISSIAVLPFSNLSGDEEQEYFSDGMTELLINEIGRIGALRVISKTSVMQFKKTEKPLLEIAKELGVDAVVEASVLQTGERIRITAQLIRAEPEEMLWSDSYNRDGRDVAILLSEVTRAIADRIQAIVTPEEEERLTQVRPDPGDSDTGGRGATHAGSDDRSRCARSLSQGTVLPRHLGS
jgi:TolB-like protein